MSSSNETESEYDSRERKKRKLEPVERNTVSSETKTSQTVENENPIKSSNVQTDTADCKMNVISFVPGRRCNSSKLQLTPTQFCASFLLTWKMASNLNEIAPIFRRLGTALTLWEAVAIVR